MANIFEVLTRYAGLWVAVDREGTVLGTGADLDELRTKAPAARTFVFASGESQP